MAVHPTLFGLMVWRENLHLLRLLRVNNLLGNDSWRPRSRRDDSLERQAIETALATVYLLMTGDLAHPSGVVARDLSRWLERNKHLAQDITRRQQAARLRASARAA